MRTLLSHGMIVTTTVLLVLAGCAKKESPAPPAKAKSTTPTTAKTTTATSPAPASPAAPAAKPATQSTASNPTVTPAPEKAIYIGQVLALWNGGKKGDAINQFLQINLQDPAVFQGVATLTMTEQQLAPLSEAQRSAILTQAQKISEITRALAQAVIASADSFIASSNSAGARSRIDAVQQFGQILATPEHLQAVQAAGKDIVQLAQQKLSGLK